MPDNFFINKDFADTILAFKIIVFMYLIIMIIFPVWVIFLSLKNLL